MMQVSNPAALWWALLAVPIVLLYLRTTRTPRHTVATGFLWAKALEEHKVRSRWRPWRQPVSLALQLAILALIVLATAGPAGRATWLLVSAAAILVLESYFFHRRWTC